MRKLITLISCLCFVGIAQAEQKTITLTQDNTLVLDAAFDTKSVNKVMSKAKELDAKLASGYPMYLFLYTPGGSIQAGVELIEFLSGLNRPVHTVTMFAASMGFQTVQHLGTRYITRYGILMSHKAYGSFRGEFGGTISQIDSRYAMWLRRVKMMDEQTVKRTNGKQTLKSYTNAYSPELWLNGIEAVEQGYADEVVTLKCDDSLNKSVEDTFSYGPYSFVVIRPLCPIQTGFLKTNALILTNKGMMELSEFLSKNGQFGGCVKTVKTTTSYYTPYQYDDEEVIEKALETELCAKDEKLTLESLLAKKKEFEKSLSEPLKNKVIYSY